MGAEGGDSGVYISSELSRKMRILLSKAYRDRSVSESNFLLVDEKARRDADFRKKSATVERYEEVSR